MKTEVFEALAINIRVEIFDLDMREVIWPMSGDHDDPGVWLLKKKADKLSDDEIGKWFLNRYLLDYGNKYEYTVKRGDTRMAKFKRKVVVEP